MLLKSKLVQAAVAVERLFRPARITTPTEVESILILEYRLPLGCCVHQTPLYEAIKQSRPEITLTVATRGLGAALLRHNPYIDHLIDTPDPLTDTLSAARHLRAELRHRNITPHLTLTGASDQRSRIALLAFLASPSRRAGYTLVPHFYHHPVAYDPTLSLIDNNLRLAPFAACSPAHREPTVFFSTSDLATARTLAAEANSPASVTASVPDSVQARPLLILVTQPSGGQATGWHPDRFAAVARYAAEALGFALAWVGIAADREPIEALRAATNGAGTNLAGRTSITELAALLAISDYLVSLDTGTMHLGRAVGTPLVVLGPSWQKPLEWLPLTVPAARILRGPDVETVPPKYKLDEVTVPQVLTALQDLLASYPPSAEARAARITHSLSSIDHKNS